MKTVEFWYSLTSPYSYLAAMRLDGVAEKSGVRIIWRPVVMPPIFKHLGWKVNPFADFPVKFKYAIRDVSREAERNALTFHKPEVFPQNPFPATKVALVAFKNGFGEEFSKIAYLENFQNRKDISNKDTLLWILEKFFCDGEAGDVLEESFSPEIDKELDKQVKRAIKLGIFGVPTFVVGTELFWGNDRMERAFEWARNRQEANE